MLIRRVMNAACPYLSLWVATSIMGISLFRSIESQYDNLRRLNSVPMMNVISHQIEDQVIQHRLPADFFAGFQRFSHFPEQLRRYSRLGAICRRVYVFGIADCEPPSIPGIEFIELSPTSPLALEWFLLVDTPDFWATLIAREEPGQQDALTKGRRFDAIWSYDAAVIERISLLMSQVMERPFQPLAQRNYAQQNMHISEMSCRMVDLLEASKVQGQRRWSQLHALQSLSQLSAGSLMLLLQENAQILLDIFGATSVVIALKVRSSSYKVVVAAGDAVGKGWKLDAGEGLCGRAMEEGRDIRVSDTAQSRQHEPLMPGAKSLIAAPIAHRKIHGALLVGHAEAQVWREEDADTIAAAASFLAVQVEHKLTQAATKSNLSNKKSGAYGKAQISQAVVSS